jgi:hypothetical protein
MDDLFRFVALRAPDEADPNQTISLTHRDDFQHDLAGIHPPPDPAPPAPPVRIPPFMPHPLEAAQRISKSYMNGAYGGGFIRDPSTLPLAKSFDDFYKSVSDGAQALNLHDLGLLIQKAFNKNATAVVTDPEFKQEKINVWNSIIAVFICPVVQANPIEKLTRLARTANLIERVADQDKSLDDPGALQAALARTLLLPPAIFPIRRDLPKPVGVGDLLVVKQHIKRYEAGEIANIENILRGESRKKTTKHSLTLDQTTVTETEKTTETTTELTTTERFELKTEAENTVKEDINAHAGMSVSAKYGSVEINANAEASYGLSKTESTKAATDHAKDVTSRAASKVTERVRQQITSRTIEILEEDEEHGFDNTGGAKNVSGIYQWINKVYEAQVLNYGRRLLFDLMIPEPAAFLTDAMANKDQKDIIRAPEPFVLIMDNPGYPLAARPVQPGDLGPDGLLKPGLLSRPVTPQDLSESLTDIHSNYDPKYYGHYVAKYGVPGVKAPPEPMITVSKGLTGNKDDQDHLAIADNLVIPAGYKASNIAVRGGFTIYEQEDGDEAMWVFVGRQTFEARGQGNLVPKAPLIPHQINDVVVDEQGSIPIAVETQQARDFAITVDVTCIRTPAALDQWRIETHGAIMNAYAKAFGDYQDKRAVQAMPNAGQNPVGSNPDQNRVIELTELKKACISRLAAMDIYDANFDDIRVEPINDPIKDKLFPRPNVPPLTLPAIAGGDQGTFIRFFEQAFEWEQMMYLFYPYYWGRHQNWYSSVLLDNTDPLFAEFLKAGAARVVVPVRLQLEADVRYFLMTGQIWNAGGLPEITDTDYLPITEEIKARDNAPGDEKPQGDPWEVVLPTTLIKLRDDDTLPIWKKFVVNASDIWVSGRMQQDNWIPDYGKVDGSGNWTPP